MKLRVIDPLTIAGVIYILALLASHTSTPAEKKMKAEQQVKASTEIINVVKK